MIFSVLRIEGIKDEVKEIVCDDADLENALVLADAFIKHSLEVYELLPRKAVKIEASGIAKFYSYLPSEVTTAAATIIGEKEGFRDRTVRQYLKKLVERGLITQSSHGKYKKGRQE